MRQTVKTPRQKAMDLCEEVVWWHRALGSPVQLADVMSDSRLHWVCAVRGDCVRRIRSAFAWSYPRLGNFFGLDHTTCVYHVHQGRNGSLRSALSSEENRAMIAAMIDRLKAEPSVNWAVIPSHPRYSVSDNGLIRFDKTGYVRKWQRGENRYAFITFAGQGGKPASFRSVHSLILEAFHGPRPEGMQVCHIDGDRFNNRLSNLRYGTAKDNADDRFFHGNTCAGIKNGNAKIIDQSVIDGIRAEYASGKTTQYALAAKHDISQAQINNIVLNKQHKTGAGVVGKAEVATGENYETT